jgi:hypothetical protein
VHTHIQGKRVCVAGDGPSHEQVDELIGRRKGVEREQEGLHKKWIVALIARQPFHQLCECSVRRGKEALTSAPRIVVIALRPHHIARTYPPISTPSALNLVL